MLSKLYAALNWYKKLYHCYWQKRVACFDFQKKRFTICMAWWCFF